MYCYFNDFEALSTIPEIILFVFEPKMQTSKISNYYYNFDRIQDFRVN